MVTPRTANAAADTSASGGGAGPATTRVESWRAASSDITEIDSVEAGSAEVDSVEVDFVDVGSLGDLRATTCALIPALRSVRPTRAVTARTKEVAFRLAFASTALASSPASVS